jgi:hypothetical protein
MSDKNESWAADECRVFMGDGGISLHRVPNGVERARLIAAAPDLLAALVALRSATPGTATQKAARRQADAAIAKATG